VRLFRYAIVSALIAFQAAASFAQQPPGGASAEIKLALAEEEAGQDIAARRYVLGESLATDVEVRHAFDVERGETYLAIGVCNDSCGDIDIVIEDGSGNVLGNDEAHGAEPFVVFSPQDPGRVSVILVMKECGEDACEYGLGFYELTERGEASR
jgi:hypothetical protein